MDDEFSTDLRGSWLELSVQNYELVLSLHEQLCSFVLFEFQEDPHHFMDQSRKCSICTLADF